MAAHPQRASNDYPTGDSTTTRNSPTTARGDARDNVSRDVLRTTCGREFTVGNLRLEHLAQPAARVSLSTRLLPQDADTLWASFTAQEARRLAAYLLAHAAAVEAATMASPPSHAGSPAEASPRFGP